MANFRTTSDLVGEVLQKAGEVNSTQSSFYARALLYLNKAHQAIIGGGSIFSLKVDEAWTWARSRHPIILDLQPAYTTGTVTIQNGNANITFSTAPSSSLEEWHLQLVGHRTVYKLKQHNSGETGAVLDSAAVEVDGAYTFRCFKLDYEVTPAYLYIDNTNDRLEFTQNGSTILTASLTHGSYTPSALLTHIISKMNTVGTSVHSGSYDSVTRKFTITSSGSGSVTLAMTGVNSTNAHRSVLPTIGFDVKLHTGALTYTSTYPVNGISRLVEPFRLYTDPGGDGKVTGMDPMNLEDEFPIAEVSETLPSRFAKIEERNDGTYVVRFNAYPAEVTKLILDWVPVPHDLQNNAYSIPRVPRKDIDVLIHAAACFILFDKSSTKFEPMLNITRAGLEAMEKKNRSEMFRVSANFGQITPREDLTRRVTKLKYGYAVTGPTSNTEGVNAMISVQLTESSFSTASTVSTTTGRTMPANHVLNGVIVRLREVFVASGMTACRLDVGIQGDTTKFINGFNLMGSIGDQDSSNVIYFPAASTPIILTVTATGANLNTLTAGDIDIHFDERLVTV